MAAVVQKKQQQQQKPAVVKVIKPKKKTKPMLTSTTYNAVLVLLVAIVASVAWNRYILTTSVDAHVAAFFASICRSDSTDSGKFAFCNSDLIQPVRRTHETARPVAQHSRLVSIPRSRQIWDLDALRSPLGRDILQHLDRDNNILDDTKRLKGLTIAHHIEPLAILAAYVAQLRYHVNQQKPNDDETTTPKKSIPKRDPVMSPEMIEYFDILPSRQDLNDHPVTWDFDTSTTTMDSDTTTSSSGNTNNNNNLNKYLKGTSALDIVQHLQQQIRHEYQTFCDASLQFDDQVTLDDYLWARLVVLTRNFSTGSLLNTETNDNDNNNKEANGEMSLKEELRMYKEDHGLDMMSGSHALVPILDMYHHHNHHPNIQFGYNRETRSFDIVAARNMEPGTELRDVYGKHTDSDLFAKYGFVNGNDLPEYLQGRISIFHSSLGKQINGGGEPSLIQALRYLDYDDGYESCVTEDQPEAWKFKQVKLKAMHAILFHSKRWIFRVRPKISTQGAGLAISTLDPNVPLPARPALDVSNSAFDARDVLSTCRLMSLTHHDLNGTATEHLERYNLHNASYIVPMDLEHDKELEYRTLMCTARMAGSAIQKIDPRSSGRSSQAMADKIGTLPPQTVEWYTAHVKYGELQALEILHTLALRSLQQFESDYFSSSSTETMEEVRKTNPRYQMRNTPCGVDFVEPLYNAVVAQIQQ